jgi:hypothetical protein
LKAKYVPKPLVNQLFKLFIKLEKVIDEDFRKTVIDYNKIEFCLKRLNFPIICDFFDGFLPSLSVIILQGDSSSCPESPY